MGFVAEDIFEGQAEILKHLVRIEATPLIAGAPGIDVEMMAGMRVRLFSPFISYIGTKRYVVQELSKVKTGAGPTGVWARLNGWEGR